MRDRLVNLYVAFNTNDMLPLLKAASVDIQKEDLFEGLPWASSGMETEPHVTIMLSETTVENMLSVDKVSRQIISKQLDLIKNTKIKVTGISYFSKDDYDVLKYDVCPDNILVFRDFVRMQFGVEATFPTFIPHITIAYLKKGVVDSLIENLPKEITLDIDISSVKINVRGYDIGGKDFDEKSEIKL